MTTTIIVSQPCLPTAVACSVVPRPHDYTSGEVFSTAEPLPPADPFSIAVPRPLDSRDEAIGTADDPLPPWMIFERFSCRFNSPTGHVVPLLTDPLWQPPKTLPLTKANLMEHDQRFGSAVCVFKWCLKQTRQPATRLKRFWVKYKRKSLRDKQSVRSSTIPRSHCCIVPDKGGQPGTEQ